MKKEILFDQEYYMHGLCQYFAYAAQKIYGGEICLWLDYDYDLDKNVLCHAYVKLAPNLYMDANGTFSDISEREDDFEFNEQNIVSGTPEKMKKILQSIGLDCTNSKYIKPARDFLQNNMPVIKHRFDGKIYCSGLSYVPQWEDKFLTVMYFEKSKSFGQFIHTFRTHEIMDNFICHLGFKPNPNWLKS